MKSALVIGGGIGGLSCAIRLAGAGVQVTLIEQQATLGGKLQRVKLADYTFDRGPSTITMIDAFARVFSSVGRHIEDYVHFYPMNPMARNYFADGTSVDLTSDVASMQAQIAVFSREDATNYPKFMAEARKLYQIAKQAFLQQMMLGWRDKLKPALIRSFMQIHPFTTLQQLLRRYFKHPNTLAMFGRYATYVGSSPYQSPAIFAMMASLEAEEGIYGVFGGTYEIVVAMEKLANELGVRIEKSTKVKQFAVKSGNVKVVETDRGTFQADVVVANADALTVYSEWIDEVHRPSMSDRKIERYEPSLSGFVVLAGVKKQYPQLLHHTVFFPGNYQQEFKELFVDRVKLSNPTIYVCYNGYDESEMAPQGASNLFVLVNAPSQQSQLAWTEEECQVYADMVMQQLEVRGLTDLTQSIEVADYFTPRHLQQVMGAHQGGIYGISSNSPQQTFFRPENRAKDIDNLWFVGGTTHPGGGTPIVALSGQLVAERILSLVLD
jgi:phytoene desaturase